MAEFRSFHPRPEAEEKESGLGKATLKKRDGLTAPRPFSCWLKGAGARIDSKMEMRDVIKFPGIQHFGEIEMRVDQLFRLGLIKVGFQLVNVRKA